MQRQMRLASQLHVRHICTSCRLPCSAGRAESTAQQAATINVCASGSEWYPPSMLYTHPDPQRRNLTGVHRASVQSTCVWCFFFSGAWTRSGARTESTSAPECIFGAVYLTCSPYTERCDGGVMNVCKWSRCLKDTYFLVTGKFWRAGLCCMRGRCQCSQCSEVSGFVRYPGGGIKLSRRLTLADVYEYSALCR